MQLNPYRGFYGAHLGSLVVAIATAAVAALTHSRHLAAIGGAALAFAGLMAIWGGRSVFKPHSLFALREDHIDTFSSNDDKAVKRSLGAILGGAMLMIAGVVTATWSLLP